MYQWKVNPLICCWVIKCSDFLLFTHLIRGNAGKAGFGIVYQLLRTWERSYFCVYVTIIFMFIYGFVFVFLFIIASTPKKGGTCVLFRLADQIESLSIGSKSCPRWFSRRTSLSTQMESTFYTMHARGQIQCLSIAQIQCLSVKEIQWICGKEIGCCSPWGKSLVPIYIFFFKHWEVHNIECSLVKMASVWVA